MASRDPGYTPDLSEVVPLEQGLPELRRRVDEVPTNPGCYLWKDAHDEVIYVGKAKNLRARLRQYVTLQDDREKIPLMCSDDIRRDASRAVLTLPMAARRRALVSAADRVATAVGVCDESCRTYLEGLSSDMKSTPGLKPAFSTAF